VEGQKGVSQFPELASRGKKGMTWESQGEKKRGEATILATVRRVFFLSMR